MCNIRAVPDASCADPTYAYGSSAHKASGSVKTPDTTSAEATGVEASKRKPINE
jgi:hypothetical protein